MNEHEEAFVKKLKEAITLLIKECKEHNSEYHHHTSEIFLKDCEIITKITIKS